MVQLNVIEFILKILKLMVMMFAPKKVGANVGYKKLNPKSWIHLVQVVSFARVLFIVPPYLID